MMPDHLQQSSSELWTKRKRWQQHNLWSSTLYVSTLIKYPVFSGKFFRGSIFGLKDLLEKYLLVWFSEWESFEAVPPHYPGQASVPTDNWQPGSGPVHASDYQWLVKHKAIGCTTKFPWEMANAWKMLDIWLW